jgi:protein OS-9
MTMPDTILFVKETRTCSYVLVINTPRLCGEPGFKSRLDQREETPIRCRHIVDANGLAAADRSLPETDSPIHLRRPVPKHPPLDAAANNGAAKSGSDVQAEEGVDEATASLSTAIQRAIQRMISKAGLAGADDAGAIPGTVVVEDAGDGEMVIEFVSDIDLNEELELDIEYDVLEREDGATAFPDSARLAEALRAAGIDVRAEKPNVKRKKGEEKDKERERGSGSTGNGAGTEGRHQGGKKRDARVAWPGQAPRVEL